jgi:hypothetical protein
VKDEDIRILGRGRACICTRTISFSGCKIENARREEAALLQAVERCKALDTGKGYEWEIRRAMACLQNIKGRDPEKNMAFITNGFRPSEVECTGAGKGVVRFAQFRCKVVVWDVAPSGTDLKVGGRLLITVTSPRTFNWDVIG